MSSTLATRSIRWPTRSSAAGANGRRPAPTSTPRNCARREGPQGSDPGPSAWASGARYRPGGTARTLGPGIFCGFGITENDLRLLRAGGLRDEGSGPRSGFVLLRCHGTPAAIREVRGSDIGPFSSWVLTPWITLLPPVRRSLGLAPPPGRGRPCALDHPGFFHLPEQPVFPHADPRCGRGRAAWPSPVALHALARAPAGPRGTRFFCASSAWPAWLASGLTGALHLFAFWLLFDDGRIWSACTRANAATTKPGVPLARYTLGSWIATSS